MNGTSSVLLGSEVIKMNFMEYGQWSLSKVIPQYL